MNEVRLNYNFLLGVLLVISLAVWLFAGGPYFIVQPDEEGVVKTFGRFTQSTGRSEEHTSELQSQR